MPSSSSAPAVALEPLWHLLYRYWFWGWLFLDVNRGDIFRRAAAWRHNLAQRDHLPVYMRRWCACLVATTAVAVAIESLNAPVIAAAFYVISTFCAVVEVFTGVAWVFLRDP